ncbi:MULTISPECIES: DUF6252 family protein [Flavobacteriaceae]|uniref:Uncharacterized protein n=2 Tax=Flavobacteriaceae TaxID=49546 RepID=A0A2T0MAY9_9FLAO|nr:DUF6252 family protein [Allomuricauda pacifica]PRX54671.1 hypothetical protein CLV81_3074 [Allomuricauda pacifica]
MKRIIPILFAILLIACSSDDDSSSMDDDGTVLGDSFITAKINGNDFEAIPVDRGVPTISAELDENAAFFSLVIAGIDLFENITEGESIIIAMTGVSFDLVFVGAEVNNPVDNPLELAFGGGYAPYETGGESNVDFDTDGSSGFLRITAIDKEAQIISGEFEYNVENPDTGELLQITDGIFNNISYTDD